MGKGDKKSRRGKIVNQSYGVRRRRKKLSSGTLPPAKEKTVRTKSEPTATTTAPKAKMAAKGASDKAPAKPQKEKAEKTTAD